MAANKLTLSLRAYTYKGDTNPSSTSRRRKSWIGASTFGFDAGYVENDISTNDTHVDSYELPPRPLKKDGDDTLPGSVNTYVGY